MLSWLKNLDPDTAAAVRLESRLKYLSDNPLRNVLVQRFVDTVLKLVMETSAQTVLDVGCGEGLLEYYLLQHHPSLSIFGADLDHEIITIPPRLNPKGAYFLAEAGRLPVPDKSFDLVLINEVLEHLHDYPGAVAEAARVSANYAIFSVPRWPLYQAANFLIGKNWRSWGEHPGHVVSFTAHKLVDVLKVHFEQVRVCSSFPWLIAAAQHKPQT